MHLQAGLFAAFLSAFLIDTLGRLEEDSTATLLDVMIYQTQMMRNETLPPYHREPFTPSPQIVAVNMLFFASLTLILIVAFISMLVKEWIREFDRGLAAIVKPRRRALVREYRFSGLERWKFLEVVHFLPGLIHLSLFLFFCGLSLFLLDIEAACGFVVAAIFALGVLFYVVTTAIAALCDSAPFRSPLSRALGRQFRRLHFVLLNGSTLWRSCLIRMANTDYPRFIRTLFYRIARIAQWKPFSETYFRDQAGDLVWNEQHINVSGAVINRLYKSLPDEGVPRELFRSIVLAGDPAHMLHFMRSLYLLKRCAHNSDEMTPEVARAVGLLICRTNEPSLPSISPVEPYMGNSLLCLTRSSRPWDRLLACLIQSQLPKYHDAARSLQSTNAEVLEAIHMMKSTANRVLLIVRFLGSTVSPDTEPEGKAAAVRILSALLLRLLPFPFSFSSDQRVHAILHVFVAINDVPLSDVYLHSPLSEFPSLPYLAYNPGVLSQVLIPSQWCKQGTSVLPACREFARTLLKWLWYQLVYDRLDSRILHELPLSQLEEYVLDPASGPQDNLILASLLLEALISTSGRPRSEFPPVHKKNLKLEEVLTLYDSYLIQCYALPSPSMQKLLNPSDCVFLPHGLTLEIHHPWLALHKYTLMQIEIPFELVPVLKWLDTPACDMIACDRLELYGRISMAPEPPLISLFLSSGAYETVLRAFEWHIKLLTDLRRKQEDVLPLMPDLEKPVAILFGSHLDEGQIVSSWIFIFDSIIPSWSVLPNELKLGFVSGFFKCESGVQTPSSNQNTCVGIAWIEHLWSTVLTSLAGAVYIEDVNMAQDHSLFDRNTGWSGPIKMEPEEGWLSVSAYNRNKRRKDGQQQERARRRKLVRSVDKVLLTLATLLDTAHGAGVLSIKAVAHLRGSPLLAHPRLYQDADSVKRIGAIIEYYRPHLHPLPECMPHEAELLSMDHII